MADIYCPKDPTVPRYLVTTADERSWRADRPLLFLGDWCCLYGRKHVWQTLDAEIAEPYGLQPGQKDRELAYVLEVTERLLVEVARALNEFHRTRHDLRHWKIVLGHWLRRYVEVVFNRYSCLIETLERYTVAGTLIFGSDTYRLATTNSMEFIWAVEDDVWNHVLYSRIIEFIGMDGVEEDRTTLAGLSGFRLGIERPRNSLKRTARQALSKLLPALSRRNDAFIANTYLPLSTELRLHASFRQVPQLWQSPSLQAVPPRASAREHFGIPSDGLAGFEKLVRVLLSAVLPTCYLEGYASLRAQVESLPWPMNPKFIFVSNGFDTDEIFKLWTATKTAEGVPYFVGQHGNNFGTLPGSLAWPELTTSNRFFTWGWQSANPAHVPAFILKTSGRKDRAKPDGGVLLIEPLMAANRLGPEDAYHNFARYQDDQFRFVAALPSDIRKMVTVRIHPACVHYRWSDEERWRDASPNTRIETGPVSIKRLVAESRVVVHAYDSTGILETLSLNMPTICYWRDGLDHLMPEAKPYYELLRKARILNDTPEEAAATLSRHWHALTDWWNSDEIQDVRSRFCGQYARWNAKPVRTLRKLIRQHLRETDANQQTRSHWGDVEGR